MPLNLKNFLISLAYALAADVSEDGADPVELATDVFVLNANEKRAAAAYIVLRNYGGNPPGELRRIPEIAVQFMARARVEALALYLANRFYEGLFISEDGVLGAEGGGPPRNNWNIAAMTELDGAIVADPDLPNGWRVHLITPQAPPATINVDATTGWVDVVFNCDVRFDGRT